MTMMWTLRRNDDDDTTIWLLHDDDDDDGDDDAFFDDWIVAWWWWQWRWRYDKCLSSWSLLQWLLYYFHVPLDARLDALSPISMARNYLCQLFPSLLAYCCSFSSWMLIDALFKVITMTNNINIGGNSTLGIGWEEVERTGNRWCCCYHRQYLLFLLWKFYVSIYCYAEAIENTLKQYVCLACIYRKRDLLLSVSVSYVFSKESSGDIYQHNTWRYVRTYRYISTYV